MATSDIVSVVSPQDSPVKMLRSQKIAIEAELKRTNERLQLVNELLQNGILRKLNNGRAESIREDYYKCEFKAEFEVIEQFSQDLERNRLSLPDGPDQEEAELDRQLGEAGQRLSEAIVQLEQATSKLVQSDNTRHKLDSVRKEREKLEHVKIAKQEELQMRNHSLQAKLQGETDLRETMVQWTNYVKSRNANLEKVIQRSKERCNELQRWKSSIVE